MSVLLSVEKLELAYGQVAVCRDISMHIERGEIVAFIGANGAGKSTILRAIAGLLPPRRGSILFCGRDVTAMPSHERTQSRNRARSGRPPRISRFSRSAKTSSSAASKTARMVQNSPHDWRDIRNVSSIVRAQDPECGDIEWR